MLVEICNPDQPIINVSLSLSMTRIKMLRQAQHDNSPNDWNYKLRPTYYKCQSELVEDLYKKCFDRLSMTILQMIGITNPDQPIINVSLSLSKPA